MGVIVRLTELKLPALWKTVAPSIQQLAILVLPLSATRVGSASHSVVHGQSERFVTERHIRHAFELTQAVALEPKNTETFSFETALGEIENFETEKHAAYLASFDAKYFEVMAVMNPIDKLKIQTASANSHVRKSHIALSKIVLPNLMVKFLNFIFDTYG
ncbi:hypothetical protein PR048_023050 [Dryococelus australis]|uniref:Uncharacterized protein n=1 Tax=Dryococelus australis TaxID=614101 RepID=A0ABQ9GT14_9NEOP|nr:hypothetical protein PR048_023050 [Dryococelus australis]